MTGSASEPFWMAPRRLRLLLEDGELTATEFALLHYVGLADGERDGVTATLDHLAGLLDCSPRTARRALVKLRGAGLISSDLRQGQRAPFRLRLGPSALLRPRLRPQEGPPVAEVLAEVTSATDTAEAAAEAASGADPGDVDFGHLTRTRVETETETETETKTSALPPERASAAHSGGWPPGLGRRTLGDLQAACRLVEDLNSGLDKGTLRAFVVDELANHDAADFEYVQDTLDRKLAEGGPKLIRSEAAFARSVLSDIRNGYEAGHPWRFGNSRQASP